MNKRTFPFFMPVIAFLLVIFISSAFVSNVENNSNVIIAQDKYLPDSALSKQYNCMKDVLAINRTTFAPAAFSPGTVTDIDYRAKITQLDFGFKIKLPSETRVPTPLVVNGQLYTGGGFGSTSFYCFNAKNGSTNWSKNISDDGPSTAVYENGRIIFNTESCTIFVLNAETGEMNWSYYLGDPLMSTPTVSNGKVYTTYPAYYNSSNLKESVSLTPNHPLVCFDLETGKVDWQKWVDGDIIAHAVVQDDNLFFTTFPGTLYKMNAQSGEFIAAMNMQATASPTIEDGFIHVPHRKDKDDKVMEAIAMLDSHDMSYIKDYNEVEAVYLDKNVQNKSALKDVAMSEDAGNGFSGGAPASSGYSYAAENIGQSNVSTLQAFRGSEITRYKGKNYNTMGNKIVSTSESDGSVNWEQTITGDMESSGGFLAPPPLVIDGKLLSISLEGKLILLEPETGKELMQYDLKNTIREQAVYSDGWLYIPTCKGEIICLDYNKLCANK